MVSAAHAPSLGGYRLRHKLGSGGMAEVYLAEREGAADAPEHVVLKVILPHLVDDERFLDMFMREARVAALLEHPHIVRVHDVSVLEGRPCIVMEFLRGRDLWTVLARFGSRRVAVAPKAAAAVIAQAASGLDYAHRWADAKGRSLDLVHRDISPHNLFLTREGQVRVLDFGIAKTVYQQQKTEAGIIKGKLPYMAPEQARGLDVDGRADQFALGVILWECLVGARLFARDDPFQTMNALFYDEIPRPSSIRPGPPPELEAIVLRALSRDPTDRFASCEELAHALRGWLRDVGARSEPDLVRSLLEAAVPSAEDADFYGRGDGEEVPQSARTRSGAEQPRTEHTPSHSGIQPSPVLSAREVTTSRLPSLPAPAAQAVLDATRPGGLLGALARVPRPLLLGGAAGGALLLGLVAFFSLRASEGDPPPPAPASPVVVATPSAASAAPAPPTLVEVTFAHVPDDVVLYVDGAPLDGSVLRLVPSEVVHVVRAERGDVEVWRHEATFTRSQTLTLPALGAATAAAPEPAPPPASGSASGAAVTPATMRAPARSGGGAPGMRRRQLSNDIDTDYP